MIQCPVYLFTFYHKNNFVHRHTVGFRPTGRVAVVKRSCCNDKQIMPPESDILLNTKFISSSTVPNRFPQDLKSLTRLIFAL